MAMVDIAVIIRPGFLFNMTLKVGNFGARRNLFFRSFRGRSAAFTPLHLSAGGSACNVPRFSDTGGVKRHKRRAPDKRRSGRSIS